MARGRWSQNADGWHSWRGRSTSRGRERTRRWDKERDEAEKLRDQNKKLQQQLREAKRGAAQSKTTDDDTPHPAAREGPARHGDWECVGCGFRTNRYAREKCYRCAVTKAHSFPQPRSTSTGAPPTVDFSAPQLGATTISISSSIPSPPSPPLASAPSSTTPASTSLAGTAIIDGSTTINHQQPAPVTASGGRALGGAPATLAPALAGPEAVKSLKGQLERLTAARAATAVDPLLSHVTAGLDQQIQTIRNQLAAAQPLEVALRGTLSAVSAARQILSRAEQKAAKLEAQVVSAVAAFDAASAEVQAAQKALAEAEAATARTAGGRFDPKLLIGSHPGAALAVLSEAAAARCIIGSAGVDATLAAQVQAAFEEVQRVCRLLPADVPPPKPTVLPTAGGAPGASDASVATVGTTGTQDVQMGEAARGGISGSSHGAAPPVDPSSTAATSTTTDPATATSPEAAAAAASLQMQHHQQHLQQQQLLQQQVLAQQAADALLQQQAQAAELARQHAHAALQQASLQTGQPPQPAPAAPQSGPAAAAALGGSPTVDGPQPRAEEGQGQLDAPLAVAVPVAPRDDVDLDGGGKPAAAPPGGAGGGGQPKDDEMGGASSPHIVNKRTAAEALVTARAIAAKAKARA